MSTWFDVLLPLSLFVLVFGVITYVIWRGEIIDPNKTKKE